MPDDPGRRKFLKVATCALGGGVGLAVGVPALRLILDPTGKTTVTTPSEPLDLGLVERFKVGAEPRRVEIVAPVVKDAWSASKNVVLGAAFVRRTKDTTVEALSAVCPHLGCAVGWDAGAGNFLCPCHDSRFDVGGGKLTGPSERGLDALPITITKDGHLELVWKRFKPGLATKVDA